MFNVMAIRLSGRREHAKTVQEILTEHGCIIKMRLGLHEAGESCSNEGLIILQLCGSEPEIAALQAALETAEGVAAKVIAV